jgi:hypothetical protein
MYSVLKASSSIRAAIDLDFHRAAALVNVGRLHVTKGTFAESVFFYRSALRIRRQVLRPDRKHY